MDPETLFKHAGLDPDRIDQPRARYPFSQVCRAYENLAELTQLPPLGLEAGQYYRVTDLHAVGVTFLASQNLIEALLRLDRYETVLNTNVDYDVQRLPGRIHFLCKSIELEPGCERLAEDMRYAILLDLARRGIDEAIQPLEVTFTYTAPDDDSHYRDFFQCPVRFAQPHSYIAFSERDASLPFTASNADLARESDQILDRLLQMVDEDDLVFRVRQSIATALPSGTPSATTVAEKLLTTPRTLHRRLAELETGFRQILNSVRTDLGRAYLSETDYPITEISYLLGFTDVSAFSRAFKRWTGATPNAFRDKSKIDSDLRTDSSTMRVPTI